VRSFAERYKIDIYYDILYYAVGQYLALQKKKKAKKWFDFYEIKTSLRNINEKAKLFNFSNSVIIRVIAGKTNRGKIIQISGNVEAVLEYQ